MAVYSSEVGYTHTLNGNQRKTRIHSDKLSKAKSRPGFFRHSTAVGDDWWLYESKLERLILLFYPVDVLQSTIARGRSHLP